MAGLNRSKLYGKITNRRQRVTQRLIYLMNIMTSWAKNDSFARIEAKVNKLTIKQLKALHIKHFPEN